MANATQIINDDMTLEEKLKAIDAAMKAAQQKAKDDAQAQGVDPSTVAPIDPATFTMCEGCQ